MAAQTARGRGASLASWWSDCANECGADIPSVYCGAATYTQGAVDVPFHRPMPFTASRRPTK